MNFPNNVLHHAVSYYPASDVYNDDRWVNVGKFLYESVGPCHHCTARLRVADGGDGFQIWRLSQAADNGNEPSCSTKGGEFVD